MQVTEVALNPLGDASESVASNISSPELTPACPESYHMYVQSHVQNLTT